MNILILSCNTGGGHNAAANALAEEIRSHGDTATVLDYFCLADSRISHAVGNVYVQIVKKVPALFGFIYRIGMFVSRLVPKSPVYYTNAKMARYLAAYLSDHPAAEEKGLEEEFNLYERVERIAAKQFPADCIFQSW